jgi:hypothetical protein
MSIPFGIYDFFASALPGGLYLFIIIYLCAITGVIQIDFQALNNLSTIQIIAGAMVAYILGLVFDPVAKVWYRIFRKENAADKVFAKYKDAFPQFLFKFQAWDWPILRAFLRRENKDFSYEIERMSVLRIMLRNVSFGLAILAVILMAQFLVQGFLILHLIVSIALISVSILAGRESAKYGDWFNAGFYEAIIAYGTEASDWIERKKVGKPDGVDDKKKAK